MQAIKSADGGRLRARPNRIRRCPAIQKLGGEGNQLVSRHARHSVRDTGSVTERASVSGGTLVMGSYLITAWSTDQASAPARSSDEAELYDTNEATSEDWDLRHLRVIAVFNWVSR